MDQEFCCVNCGSSLCKQIPFRYFYKGRYIHAVKCNSCGLISLFPPPSGEEISEMYSDAYFTMEDVQTHHYKKDYLTAVQEVDYTEKVSWLKKYLPATGQILEVGCATGELLNALKQCGYGVTGVEISEFAARKAVGNYHLRVINASFDPESVGPLLQKDFFDLVIMGDVLEHFKNPADALQLAFSLLKPGGKLIVHVPSTLNLISSRLAFLIYRILGASKTMRIPPYHLTEFFPKSLEKMFIAAGFSKCTVIQETKHPKTITLRHSRLENLVKLASQYPNYYLTKVTGLFGDRLTGIGIK
jgi:2-polyprenyl-3-methyl-5-hydroxy-6-metoxy-1,4-benzoquinol methylase